MIYVVGKEVKDKGDKVEREHSLLPVRTQKINDDAHDARNAALRRTHSECVGQFL